MDCFLWSVASKDRNTLTEKYEPLQPFLFLSFLRFANVKVVLDVGSNVGLYSLMSTLSESVNTVLAFEPDKAAFPELEKNISLNGLKEKIFAHQFAVSNAEGKLKFGSHSPMSGVNGVVNTSIHDLSLFSEVHDVNTVRLDSYENIYGEVLGIKIDVEGHELSVIEGATQLLLNSPAFIQVEHYVGSGIDEKLKELGYFCFFIAGYDYYFTNIKNFSNPMFVKRAVEYASTWLIESNSGRWPNVNTIKYSVLLSCLGGDGEIEAEVSLVGSYFLEPEFAFYLLVNGSKIDEKWYQDSRQVFFNTPLQAETIEVKAFVREKKNPDKKVVVGKFIKQPAVGYRAPSAVEDSLGLPSSYSSIVAQQNSNYNFFDEIDITPLIDNLDKNEIDGVLQLGVSDAILKVAKVISLDNVNLNVICSLRGALQFRKKAMALTTTAPELNIAQNIVDVNSFSFAINKLEGKLDSVKHIVIMAQFIQDINIKMDDLSLLLSHMPAGVKIYAEALTNISYRQQLLSLAERFDACVHWLLPLSTIIPQETFLEKNSKSRSDTEMEFDFYFLGALVNLNKNISERDFHPERFIGLDFSLSEKR